MTQTHLHPSERALPFVRISERQSKPRAHGVTEIRGPYYTPMGKHYLQDILETMGAYVDTLKFAGGSFALMPYHTVVERRCSSGTSRTMVRR
jgi:phosphosulfolactate synthase (CoM biosynthesis protein A)